VNVTAQLNGLVTKTIVSGGADKAIGDKIPYKLEVNIPEGTTNNVVVTDTLPVGLAYVPNSLAIVSSASLNIQTTPVGSSENPSSNVIVAGQDQDLTWDFDKVINTDTNNAVTETISISYEAVVLNSANTQNGDMLINTSQVNLDGNITVSNAPPVTVIEPDLGVFKSESYVSGDTITYSVDVSHTPGSTAEAFDVVLTDTFPTGTSFDGNITVGPGNPTPIIDTTNFPIVTFTFTDLDLAESGQFTYEVDINSSVNSGTNLTNNVESTWTSRPASYTDPIPANDLSSERTGVITDPGGAINIYADSDSAISTVTRPNLSTSSKTVVDLNGGDLQGNDVLEYTITLTNTGNMAATGIQVTDDMPAHTNTLNVQSIAGGVDASVIGGGVNSTGFLDITGIILDAAGGANDSKTIVYRITADGDITSGTTIENSMTVHPASEGGVGATDTASINSLEPILGVTKTVSPTVVPNGSTATFTVTVENTGDSNSLNTTITDTIPAGLTYVPGSITLDGVAQTDANDAPLDNTDFGVTTANTITVVLPVLSHDPTSVEITYDVTLTNTATNTVNVTDDHGENLSASSTLTKHEHTSGSGGVFRSANPTNDGSPNNPSDDTENNRDKNNVLKNIAPAEGPRFHEYESWEPIEQCLRYDPDRNLKFSDVELNPAIDANIMKSTLLFDALNNQQYVMSGYATRLNDEGEKTAGLENTLTRLEWAKVLMVSHCLPIYDLELLPKVTAFGEPMPNYFDLPFDVSNVDAQTRWSMEVAYSASYYHIINGTDENLAAMLRPVSGAEAIKMFVRTGEFVHAGEFEKSSEGLSETLDPEAWYYDFFAKAAFEGTLKEYINSMDSAGNFVIRRNAVNLLLDALLRRDLYKLTDEEAILKVRN